MPWGMRDDAPDEITADLLLRAYAAGIFPMAEGREDPALFWVDPRERGVIPLDGFHVSRSLARRLRSGVFEATVDAAFDEVVASCADRDETWISHRIETLYGDLYAAGHAHSVEVWQDGRLAGGVYGIALGAAFFGESMMSRRTDGSKAALAWLVDRLRQGRFRLFDTQFLTDHLRSLGGVEIPRADYRAALARALATPADFDAPGPPPDGPALLARLRGDGGLSPSAPTVQR